MTLPRLLLATLALVAGSSAARAQESLFAPGVARTSVRAVAPAGPRLDAARTGIVLAPVVASEPMVPAPMYRKANVRGRNLMILGGAAILGGAIVGGDAGNLVSLGGLGVGLYGLYIYLN